MKNLLNNLPPFYVGENVVYITGNSMPKNSVHIVSDIWKDPCGCFSLSINGKLRDGIKSINPFTKCYRCEKIYSSDLEISESGWESESFKSLQKQKLKLITFKQIQENEKSKQNEFDLINQILTEN